MTGERQKKSSKNGISYLRNAELEKFANSLKNKKQFGGGDNQVSDIEESWDLVNNLLNNSAPVDLGPPRQVGQSGGKYRSKKKSYSLYGGGEESSGATFLPIQWYNPDVPLAKPNDPSQIKGAYGKINAVSGMDVNLSAFPNSSMQQTGGRPKKNKTNKPKKDDVPKEKPAKKGKKSSKKETSLWEKIKSFF